VLAALALVVFGAYDSYPVKAYQSSTKWTTRVNKFNSLLCDPGINYGCTKNTSIDIVEIIGKRFF